MVRCCPEKHGQRALARYDPFFNSTVFFTLGVACFFLLPTLTNNIKWWKYLLISILFVVGFIFLLLSNPWLRFFLRTGRWGLYPRKKEDIVKAFQWPNSPQVAGEGWYYIIARERSWWWCCCCRGPSLVALRGNWSGLVRWIGDNTVRVKTGTLMCELTRIFEDRDLAFYDRPQFDQMTIGGAVRTAAHGWCTYAWLIDSVVGLEAVERGSGKIVYRHRGDGADFLDVLFDKMYVLLEVELEGQKNRNLVIDTKRFPSPDVEDVKIDWDEWNDAPYRLLFVYQRSVLTKTGTFSTNPTKKKARVGSLGLRLQCCRRIFGKSGSWSIVESIADSHTIVQTAWPLETMVGHLDATLNVELYATNFNFVESLLPLTLFHRKRGGRTEIRVRTVADTTIYSLDLTVTTRDCCVGNFSVDTPPQVAEWHELLHGLGVREAAAHRGKYIPPSLEPLTEVSMKDLWSNAHLGEGMDRIERNQDLENVTAETPFIL